LKCDRGEECGLLLGLPKETRRATIYLDTDLHRALKLKSAELDESVSELVNGAIRQSLAEDAADLDTFEVREAEPEYPFEDFVKKMKRDGLL